MLINNGKEFLKLSFQALSLQQSEYQPILSDSQYSVQQAASQSVKLLVSQWVKEPVLSQSVKRLICYSVMWVMHLKFKSSITQSAFWLIQQSGQVDY